MDFDKLKNKASELVKQRGGMESVKEDAEELKDIATSDGSLTDKGKEAVDALKDPGAPGEQPPPQTH